MSDFPWLTVMLVLPVLGGAALPLLPKSLPLTKAPSA